MRHWTILLLNILLTGYFIARIESKKYYVVPNDEFLTWKNQHGKIEKYSKYLKIDNLLIDQIDDEHVQISGYLKWVRSMDSRKALQLNIETQYLERGVWRDGEIGLTVADLCQEFLNRNRFWYNITRLWPQGNCPPRAGDVWRVEKQFLSVLFDLPPSTPIVTWRAFLIVSQGLPAFKKNQFSFGWQFELVEQIPTKG